MTYPRQWITVALGMALGLGGAVAPAADPAPQPDLVEAVEQLGSPDPAVREEATKRLWAAGAWAEPALRRAAEGGDGVEPEAAARARLLLEKIESGVRPDTPPQALEWVTRYKTDPRPDARVAAAQRLIDFGDAGAPILLRLWAREIDPKVKDGVLRAMQASCPRYARLLLAQGDDATAEQLLEAAAQAQAGPAHVDYAAYLWARGRVRAKLEEFRAARVPVNKSPRGGPVGWLSLADGDYAAALDAARQRADDNLRDAALYASGDWKALAANTRAGADNLNLLNLRPALAHLAGDAAATDGGLVRLKLYVEEKPQYAFICAETFFAVGRAAEAIELLRPHDPASAFTFLGLRLRFDEAFALADRAVAIGAGPGGTKNAAWLHVAVARQYAALGQSDKAQAQLGAALAAAGAEGPQALAQVSGAAVEVEDLAGLREKAVARALAPQDETGRAALVARLFPPRAGDARFWWRALRARTEFRDEPPRATFDRLGALLAGRAKSQDVQAWCAAAADAAVEKQDPFARRQGLAAAYDLLRAYELDGPAVELLERAARSSGGAADALLRLGDLHFTAGRFADAAKYYERARAVTPPGQPDAALVTYLQGAALKKQGQDEASGRLIALARALPLGNEAARAALCDGLDQRGLKEEAAAEGAVLMRLGGVWSLPAADAARRAAAEALRRRDFAAAADDLDRSLLGVVRQESGFSRQEGYLAVPRAVETYRALARLEKAGSDAAAVKTAAETLRRLVPVFPADTEWTIGVVTELDKAGWRDLADALFGENAKLLAAACEQYPGAAVLHNSLAWLAARCGRDLDVALTHAKRAVELRPESSAYLDTLAEGHFRRGEKEQAIEAMKKCLELEPLSLYYRGQMKRFTSGDVKGSGGG